MHTRLAALERVRSGKLLLLAAKPASDDPDAILVVRYRGRTWRQEPGEDWSRFCLRAQDDMRAITRQPVVVVSPIDAAL